MNSLPSLPVAPPNILWVSFEDTSPRFGCYGDPIAQTPNVDRLASQGRLYTHAFSVAGVCSPSRAAIITGLYPHSAGTHHHRTLQAFAETPDLPTPYEAVIPHYAKMLPEYFRMAGYYCSNNFKTDYQFRPPFTAWHENGKNGHWRNRRDPDQPFFAVFNLEATHESGMWEEHGTPRTDPESVEVPPWIPNTPKCRVALARQYDHIEDNDTRLGELLAQLEEDGLADNTIVCLWSDHGEGIPRSKRLVYEAGTRIPLIVRWPGKVDPGEVCDDLVSLIDLAPTMLSLCGLGVPRHMQGQPFLGPLAQPRDYVFAGRDRMDCGYDMVRAARDRRFRYIRNYCPEKPCMVWTPYQNIHPMMQEMWRLFADNKLTGPQELPFRVSRSPEELYDLEVDPHELQNLSDDLRYQKDLVRLRCAVDDWLDEVGDLGPVNETDMKMGWWGGPDQPVTTPPIFVPICEEFPGIKPAEDRCHLPQGALVQIHCTTQGASIGWTTSADPEPEWQLVSGPIRLEPGVTTLRAKAIRIGYLPSDELKLTVEVG